MPEVNPDEITEAVDMSEPEEPEETFTVELTVSDVAFLQLAMGSILGVVEVDITEGQEEEFEKVWTDVFAKLPTLDHLMESDHDLAE